MATFEEYLGSIGAKQTQINPNFYVDRGSNEFGSTYTPWDTLYSGGHYWSGGEPVNPSRGLSRGTTYGSLGEIPKAQYDFGEQVQTAPKGVSWGGYTDPGGGFLGYGSTPQELQQNASPGLLSGYSDYVGQDPIREQQVIANNAARAEAFEKERLLRQQYLQGLPTIGQAPQGASALTGTPQNNPFGQPMAGRGLLATGGGLPSTGGLHRGAFGGTGLLGGGSNQ